MKEYFIVKMRVHEVKYFYTGTSTVHKNEPPVIHWSIDMFHAYRFDTYKQAQDNIAVIAQPDEFYQIDKLFVKA